MKISPGHDGPSVLQRNLARPLLLLAGRLRCAPLAQLRSFTTLRERIYLNIRGRSRDAHDLVLCAHTPRIDQSVRTLGDVFSSLGR